MTLTGSEPEERAETEGAARRAGGRRGAVIEWVLVLLVALTGAFAVKTFAVQAFYIPTPSMYPTLRPNDRVLVNKLSYDFHAVHEGDIVVFRRPPADTTLSVDDLIKRVIGLPGETIFVANCRVYVDGEQLAQPYLPAGWENPSSPYCTTWPAGLANPYTVPKGDYFVMGDNRKDSYDSRYWGPLPATYLVGRAFVRLWPLARIGLL